MEEIDPGVAFKGGTKRSHGKEEKYSLMLIESIPGRPEQSLETAISHRGPTVRRCPGCWAGAALH